jgi:hypothetical protein
LLGLQFDDKDNGTGSCLSEEVYTEWLSYIFRAEAKSWRLQIYKFSWRGNSCDAMLITRQTDLYLTN